MIMTQVVKVIRKVASIGLDKYYTFIINIL